MGYLVAGLFALSWVASLAVWRLVGTERHRVS
jgi:high-affinity nickel permease